MDPLLLSVAIIFMVSLFNIVLKKFNLPTIIGYIISGIIVGELFSLNIYNSHILEIISEFALVILMFTIGLEFSYRELKIMKKEVFIYGSLEVLIVGTIFTLLLDLLFNFDIKSSIIIGFALSLSSTAIVLKQLNENGDIHASYGRKALGILLFQDIAVIPLLLIIEAFTKDIELTKLIFQTIFNIALFFILLILLGKFVIDRFLRMAIFSKTQEVFLLAIFFVILLSAAVSHLFGFSYSLGAFFAGMLLAESHYKYQIEADLAPFRDLLLGLFFFSIGNRIDLRVIFENIIQIFILVISVMVIKAIIIYLILAIKEQKRTAFKSALALSQIGEFALALFLIGSKNGLIDDKTLQIFSSAVIISMILTPFIIKDIKKIADFIFKEPSFELKISSTALKNHIIVGGYGPLGKELAKTLKKRNFNYVIVEHDLRAYEEALKNDEPAFFGNIAQEKMLNLLNIKEALAVVLTFHNLEKIRLVAIALKDKAPHTHVLARVRDKDQGEVLKDLNILDVIVTTEILSKEMSERLLYCPISYNKS